MLAERTYDNALFKFLLDITICVFIEILYEILLRETTQYRSHEKNKTKDTHITYMHIEQQRHQYESDRDG